MGAVITIKLNTNDPNYESKIRKLSEELQSKFGEPVEIDIGIVDNQTMPGSIESNRIANDSAAKIKI